MVWNLWPMNFTKEIKKKSMKILIVGSSGYLGGRIYEYFKNKYNIYKFNQKKIIKLIL